MFEPGQILVASWGYSMTIVDFYIVERATQHSVWIRLIKQQEAPNDGARGYGSGYVIPDISLPHSSLMHRRINGMYVRGYNSSSRATLWSGKPVYYNRND